MMKLYFSPTSPFVRKTLVVAHEVGLADQIEKVDCAANPVRRDQVIIAHNALGQVPTLLLEDGTMLADSRVICEYLNDRGGGALFPATGAARWRALADQSLGDGLLGAALLARYEVALRPPEKQWKDWLDGQFDKVATTLAAIEAQADALGDRADIGAITFACGLSYLDLRFADRDWRAAHPKAAAWYAAFSQRASMRATELKG